MNEKTKTYLAALSFSAIIGFSFLFIKISLGYASPLTNLAHRYTIAALVMVVLHQTKLIKVSLSIKRYSFYSSYESFLSASLFYFSILCFTVYIVF